MLWLLFGCIGFAVFLAGCWEMVAGPKARLDFERVFVTHTKFTYRDGCVAAGVAFDECDKRAQAYASPQAGP